MKIKKFDQLNENQDTTNTESYNERNAKRFGYKVGDKVFNKVMKKVLTIVLDSDEVINDKTNTLCTLGSVGQFSKDYIPVDDKKKSELNVNKFGHLVDIKTAIDNIIDTNLMSKSELLIFIKDYIEKKIS